MKILVFAGLGIRQGGHLFARVQVDECARRLRVEASRARPCAVPPLPGVTPPVGAMLTGALAARLAGAEFFVTMLWGKVWVNVDLWLDQPIRPGSNR